MVLEVGYIFPRISGGAIDTALKSNVKMAEGVRNKIEASIGKDSFEKLLNTAAEIPAFGDKVIISTKFNDNRGRTINAEIVSLFSEDIEDIIEYQSYKSVNILEYEELIGWLNKKAKELLQTGGREPIKFAE